MLIGLWPLDFEKPTHDGKSKRRGKAIERVEYPENSVIKSGTVSFCGELKANSAERESMGKEHIHFIDSERPHVAQKQSKSEALAKKNRRLLSDTFCQRCELRGAIWRVRQGEKRKGTIGD